MARHLSSDLHTESLMASTNLELQSTECPICHEYFTEPKILPCAHLLCRCCLVTWLKAKSEAQCPLCRSGIKETRDQNPMSCDNIADSFPTDHAMATVIDSTKLLSNKHTCSACENVAAVSLCLHCSVMLCTECVRMHGKFPALKSHKLENLDTLTPEHLAASRQAPCSIHPDKTSELYCPMHNDPICHLCATSQHRTCPEVTDLAEMQKRSRETLADLKSVLSLAETYFEKSIGELEQQLAQNERNTKTAFLRIESVCNRLQRAVETCRQRLKNLVHEADEKIKSADVQRKTALVQKRSRVISHRLLVQRVLNTVPLSSLSVMTSTLQARVKELDLKTPSSADPGVFSTVKLNIDEEAVSRLDRELSKLGLVSVAQATIEKQVLWHFNKNHGCNIILTNNDQTAERTNSYHYGIVLSRNSLVENRLYEVRVNNIDPRRNGNMVVGVLVANPSSTPLPQYAGDLNTAIIIERSRVLNISRKPVFNDCGQSLADAKIGSRVGITVDNNRCLHLYLDGCDQGIAARDIPVSCYAVFDVRGCIKKVTTLPVTDLSVSKNGTSGH